MKQIELVNDYHRVLRIVKNYTADEVERLIRGLEGYAKLMRSDGEAGDDELSATEIELAEAPGLTEVAEERATAN